jgi:uncharacterized protein (TIGR00255 family)
MTGYGRASLALGDAELTIEANAVNRRGLETAISAPPEWSTALERLGAAWVREFASRGKVTLSFRFCATATAAALAWDAAAVAASLRKLAAQASALGASFAPDAALLLRLAELHRAQRETLPDPNEPETQAALASAARAALSGLVAMRETEGAFLAEDLLARVATLEGLLARVEALGDGAVARYREALFERLRQAGLALDLGDERVLREIALFADRCDIAEETTRLRSHFAQFRACVAEGVDVGRKLDFLCQEINRELNTIGSKANLVEITRHVIDAKNELERVREQVQNVE